MKINSTCRMDSTIPGGFITMIFCHDIRLLCREFIFNIILTFLQWQTVNINGEFIVYLLIFIIFICASF